MTGFGDPRWLHLLWGVPALLLIMALAANRRWRLMHRFADVSLSQRIGDRARPVARVFKAAMILGALALTTVALARPLGEPVPTTVHRAGRDVIFLVDVSRSMLAEDLAPNRLERARLLVNDALDSLEGDRAALVAFAGTAVVKCPLTIDYGFIRMMLDELSPDSVSRGGSLIGDALRKTLAELTPKSDDARFRDIILITDGEDHDSFPVEAALEAAERGVRIIVIGLGDHENGAPIPIIDEFGRRAFLEYNGEIVRSKLEEKQLREIAAASAGGVYFPVRLGAIALDEVYRDLVRESERRDLEEEQTPRHRELFQWLLAGAFALLFFEGLISERRRK